MKRILYGLLISLLWIVKVFASENIWLVVASTPVPRASFEEVGVEVHTAIHPSKHKWLYKVEFKDGKLSFQAQWALLKQLHNVEWVEPEQSVTPESLPSDVGDNRVWWQAVQADWVTAQQRDCSGTVIVVLDSGVDIQHPDLQSVIWTNSAETFNGVDDDGNGYVDDQHGWDVLKEKSVQEDAFGHGTHVAGIIGALNDNGGTAGLCSRVQILPLRFLDKYGAGYITDAVEALQYLLDLIDQGYLNGKHIILNNSWVIGQYSLSLEIMLDALHEKGVLMVNAAGNQGLNLDQRPAWPANFARNKLWQMGIGNADVEASKLAGSSNYGVQTVTVAAPGVKVLSTWPGGAYRVETGTSMATPVVSALAAMLWTYHPEWSAEEVRAVIEGSVMSNSAFLGRVKAGGIVRFAATLDALTPPPLLGYVENFTIKGVHLNKVHQLTLLNRPVAYRYDAQAEGLKLLEPETLKCGYLHANEEKVKPLYLDVIPASLENVQVQYEPDRWVFSWNSHANVDQVELQGLNKRGFYEKIAVFDNRSQSAEIEPLEGYQQLRLLAQMRCEGEDGQPVVRDSLPSKVITLDGSSEPHPESTSSILTTSADIAPVWHTRTVTPAVRNVDYAIVLSVENADTLQLGDAHTCSGLELEGQVLSGRMTQAETCMIDVIASLSDGQSAHLKLPLEILQDKPSSLPLKWENIQIDMELSGVEGILGSTLEKRSDEWVVKLVTTKTATGVLQLTAPQNRHFETNNSNYTLSPDKQRLQVALSQLSFEPVLEDKRVYSASFRLKNDVAPVKTEDTRCFFSSYLFGRNAWQTNTLRAFRDHVLLSLPGGKAVVQAYYQLAPRVLARLHELPMFADTLKFMLDRTFSPWLAAFHLVQAFQSAEQ